MSGGAYDYAYERVSQFAEDMRANGGCGDWSNAELRELFRAHLRLVADAMQAIEWNDSGDGAPDEIVLIRQCLKMGAL